jgi:hypothetical protein
MSSRTVAHGGAFAKSFATKDDPVETYLRSALSGEPSRDSLGPCEILFPSQWLA